MFAMEIQLYRVLIVVCRAGHDNDTQATPVNSCQSYTTHSDGKILSLYTLASPPVQRIGTININLIDAGESCQLTLPTSPVGRLVSCQISSGLTVHLGGVTNWILRLPCWHHGNTTSPFPDINSRQNLLLSAILVRTVHGVPGAKSLSDLCVISLHNYS